MAYFSHPVFLIITLRMSEVLKINLAAIDVSSSEESTTSSIMSSRQFETACTSVLSAQSEDSLSDFAINVIIEEDERWGGFEFINNDVEPPNALEFLSLTDNLMNPSNNVEVNHIFHQASNNVNSSPQQITERRTLNPISHLRGLLRRGAIRRRRPLVTYYSETRPHSTLSTITEDSKDDDDLAKMGFTMLYHQLFIPAYNPPVSSRRTWKQKILHEYPLIESAAISKPCSPLTSVKIHHQDLTLSIPVLTPIPRIKREETSTMIQHEDYQISDDGLIINFPGKYPWLKLFFRHCDLARTNEKLDYGEWVLQIRGTVNYDFKNFRKIANYMNSMNLETIH